MIELTKRRLDALGDTRGVPLRLLNPRRKDTYVLLPADEYERLKQDEYDDTPWTKEEIQALAWDAGTAIGWEGMDEYDDATEKP
jgi:hypothetical protein